MTLLGPLFESDEMPDVTEIFGRHGENGSGEIAAIT
jgi:hypothetical protein